jgi:thioredoxin-like negative regulator of GroEL
MALGAADGDTYAAAHQTTMETGKPMVVMVSTEWCAPCQMMKRTVIPEVRQRGLLRKVAFAIVNPDRDRELAERLTGGGPVPQLVMYRKTATGWKRRKLIGGQSVETVEQFINEGVASSAEDQPKAEASKPTPAGKPLTKASTPATTPYGSVAATTDGKAG